MYEWRKIKISRHVFCLTALCSLCLSHFPLTCEHCLFANAVMTYRFNWLGANGHTNTLYLVSCCFVLFLFFDVWMNVASADCFLFGSCETFTDPQIRCAAHCLQTFNRCERETGAFSFPEWWITQDSSQLSAQPGSHRPSGSSVSKQLMQVLFWLIFKVFRGGFDFTRHVLETFI